MREEGWVAYEMASDPRLRERLAPLSDDEYASSLLVLLHLAFEQQTIMRTLAALHQQGIPTWQTCELTRRVLLDRGFDLALRDANPIIGVMLRAAGCPR